MGSGGEGLGLGDADFDDFEGGFGMVGICFFVDGPGGIAPDLGEGELAVFFGDRQWLHNALVSGVGWKRVHDDFVFIGGGVLDEAIGEGAFDEAVSGGAGAGFEIQDSFAELGEGEGFGGEQG